MPLRSPKLSLVILISICCFSPWCGAQEKGDPARLELLRGQLERNPDDIRVALLLGGMLRGEGRDDEARSVVEKTVQVLTERIETEGDSGELQYLLGMGSLFLDRNYLARQHFQMALSLQPEREEAHLGLVRALFSLGKEAEAMQALELASALFPESESVKSQLSEVHERAGRYAAAIPILEELRILKPQDAGILKRLLNAYVEAGEVEKTAPLFEEMTQAGELSPLEASLQLFRIQLSRNDLRAARVALQEASEFEPNNPLVKDAFREYYSVQAKQAEEGGSFRRAVLFWERALESAPGDRQMQYHLALAHAALQSHDEALELFLPLLEQRPSDPRFYADLSITLIALDRFEAAARVIQLGFDLVPENRESDALARLEEARERLLEVTKATGSLTAPQTP